MARITWRNVAAPDLTDSSRSQAIAASMIGRAAESFGDSLSGLDFRARNKASQAAANEALSVTDASEWDRLMQNGGLEALGISADRATPDLLEFVAGRKDTLQQRANRDQQLTQDKFDLREDRYGLGRTQLADQRFDDKFERGEEDRLRREKAADIAYGISNNKKVYNDTEARRIAEQRAGGDRKLEDAIMAELTGRSEDINRIDPNVTFSGPTNAMLRDMDNGLQGRQQEAAIAYNQVAGLGDLATAAAEFGSEDPLNVLFDKVSGTLDNLDEEEKQKRFDETSGSMKADFDTLKDEFDLPDALIVDILSKSYQDDGIFFTGDQLENALPEARKRLQRINTPEARNAIRVQGNEVQAKMDAIATQRKTMDRLVTRLQKAHTRGDKDEIKRVQGQLAELAGSLGLQTGDDDDTTDNTGGAQRDVLNNSQVQRMLEEAAAGNDRDNPNISEAVGQSMLDSAMQGFDAVDQQVPNSLNIMNELFNPGAGANVDMGESLATVGDLPTQGMDGLNDLGRRLWDSLRGNSGSRPPAPQQGNGAGELAEMEEIITGGSLPPEINIQAEVILNALKSGRSPGSGEPLNDNSRQMLQQRLRQLIQSAG